MAENAAAASAAALSGFAGVLLYPATLPLVLALVLLLRRADRLRLAAAVLGAGSSLLEIAADLERTATVEVLAALLGGGLAGLALAELWLALCLPLLRSLRRAVNAAWRIVGRLRAGPDDRRPG